MVIEFVCYYLVYEGIKVCSRLFVYFSTAKLQFFFELQSAIFVLYFKANFIWSLIAIRLIMNILCNWL